MATVTLYQPVDMSGLPTTTQNLFNWSTYYDNAEVDFGSYGYMYFLGSFTELNGYAIDGNVTKAAFDFLDSDPFPNLVVDGTNFHFNSAYYNDVLLKGNFAQIVKDLLADNDRVSGTMSSDTLNGYAGSDTLHGYGGNDHLIGGGARDKLFGDNGADVLNGGDGKDILIGGAGRDHLVGKAGADSFRFLKVSDSPTSAILPDVIEDFRHAQGDKIDLSHIDANTNVAGNQAFEFIAQHLFTGNAGDAQHRGELRYVVVGSDITILGDVNGDSVADFAITATGLAGAQATDFIL